MALLTIAMLTYEVRAGDALYIPAGWWHEVLTLNLTLTLTLTPTPTLALTLTLTLTLTMT